MTADFPRMLADLKQTIARARKEGVSLAGEKTTFRDFTAQHREQLRKAVLTGVAALAKVSVQGKAAALVQQLQVTQDLAKLDVIADELLDAVTEREPALFSLKKPRLPWEIHDEVTADLDEVQRCMESQCYRSAVILCGRILETALHRKYFDVTKNDLLEKSPGIGLGNLVAKLAEHNVNLDPALGNQIHLINQVRIHSVHQKQDAFKPSEAQAQAIVLYTTDILEKLFA
jgi:hypothetical protein